MLILQRQLVGCNLLSVRPNVLGEIPCPRKTLVLRVIYDMSHHNDRQVIREASLTGRAKEKICNRPNCGIKLGGESVQCCLVKLHTMDRQSWYLDMRGGTLV